MPLVLPIHIVAGLAGLFAGFVALAVRKGGWVHRKSGLLFVAALVTMCVTGFVVAVGRAEAMNAIAAVMTAYLGVTALTTVRPLSRAGRQVDLILMLVVAVLALTTLSFGIDALRSPTGEAHGLPPFPFFLFAVFGLLAAAGDLRIARSRRLEGARRLSRHLWRMCLALFIMAMSFFPNRSRVVRVFPEAIVTPVTQAMPIVVVLAVMVYWLWRLRRPSAAAAAEHASEYASQNFAPNA